MKFTGNCLPTGIGSLPFTDSEEACTKILKFFDKIPFWPQLPKRDFKEQMYTQFSEGFPAFVVDEANHKVYFRCNGELFSGLAEFYEKYLSEDLDFFSINPAYAAGLYWFLNEKEKVKGISPIWLKGQITGIISFGLSVTDQNFKPILYNTQLMEAVITGLKMKVRWQARQLKKISPNLIIFIDEPYLASVGSGFISLTKENVIDNVRTLTQEIWAEKATAGVHCCGNTDWSLLIESGVNLLSFDAYEYGENFLLYSNEIKDFMEKGGVLSWGIVPTSEKAGEESAESLTEKLELLFSELNKRGVEKELILSNSIITPSCGMGTLKPELAEKILGLTVGVSNKIREKYKLNN